MRAAIPRLFVGAAGHCDVQKSKRKIPCHLLRVLQLALVVTQSLEKTFEGDSRLRAEFGALGKV